MSKFLLPFSLGVAAGVYLSKNWPTIKEQAVPATQEALKNASELLEKGRQAWMEATAQSATADNGAEAPQAAAES